MNQNLLTAPVTFHTGPGFRPGNAFATMVRTVGHVPNCEHTDFRSREAKNTDSRFTNIERFCNNCSRWVVFTA